MANKCVRKFMHGLSLQDNMAARALPLQYIHRLPSAPLSCSINQGKCLFSHQKEIAVKQQQHLVRTRSSSLLQAKHQLKAVLKALLHRPCSHCHLNDGGHSLKACHQLHKLGADRCCNYMPESCSSSKLVKSKCIPKGHVAVYVEAGQKRHVVPIAYLREPHFQALLEQAEREYGFAAQGPGLHLPCSFTELHHTLHQISSC